MEKSSNVTKNDLIKAFKKTIREFSTENKNQLSREQAVKIIIESMKKCGQACTAEEPVKFLEMFDSEGTKRHKKQEVKKCLLATAKVVKLNKKKVTNMKAKWGSKPNRPQKTGDGPRGKRGRSNAKHSERISRQSKRSSM